MPDKLTLAAVVMILMLACILSYLLVADPFGHLRKPKPRVPLPLRGQSSALQVLETYPSSGRAWSMKTYPEQYRDAANLAVAPFVGVSTEDDTRFPENERFMDIAGRGYSRKLLDDFSYTSPDAKRPEVRVEYLKRGETFIGRIVGSGLKPNFAYQIKLRGQWGDRKGFEKIGYTGRWRLPGRETNYSDKDYEAFPHKEQVEAYVLFDFFVTDPAGRVDKPFYLDSALHVLWNYEKQRGYQPGDTYPQTFTREGADRALYAHPKAEFSSVRLFAESEQHNRSTNNRKPVGEALLPEGNYKAILVFTEESFHGFGDAGLWATVMSAPVEFEVVAQLHPPTGLRLKSESGAGPIDLDQAALQEIEVTSRTTTGFEGNATGDMPSVTLPVLFDVPEGARYLLSAELYAAGNHTWQIHADHGRGEFDSTPHYSIPSTGPRGWQRFEVEITSAVAGKPARLQLVLSRAKGPVGIRDVTVRRVVEGGE